MQELQTELLNAIDALNDAKYHLDRAAKLSADADLLMAQDQNQMNLDRVQQTFNLTFDGSHV